MEEITVLINNVNDPDAVVQKSDLEHQLDLYELDYVGKQSFLELFLREKYLHATLNSQTDDLLQLRKLCSLLTTYFVSVNSVAGSDLPCLAVINSLKVGMDDLQQQQFTHKIMCLHNKTYLGQARETTLSIKEFIIHSPLYFRGNNIIGASIGYPRNHGYIQINSQCSQKLSRELVGPIAHPFSTITPNDDKMIKRAIKYFTSLVTHYNHVDMTMAVSHRLPLMTKLTPPKIQTPAQTAEYADIRKIIRNGIKLELPNTPIAFARTLARLGLYNIMYAGKEDWDNILAQFREQIAESAQNKAIQLKRKSDYFEVRNILFITAEMFPELYKIISPEYEKLVRYGIKHIKPEKILGLIPGPDRERVLAEIKANEEMLLANAAAADKCKHKMLMAMFMTEVNIKSRQNIYSRLRPFLGANYVEPSDGILHDITNSYIKCAQCGENIICPHEIDRLVCEITSVSPNDFRNQMYKYAVHGNCKICGTELISKHELPSNLQNANDKVDSELMDIIWAETYSACASVNMSKVVVIKPLAEKIATMIYPYVFEYQQKLHKSKTLTDFNIKARKKLYSAMFAYVAVVHLIVNGTIPGEFAGQPNKSAPGVLSAAILQFRNHKIALINKIPEININEIKTMMISIFSGIGNLFTQATTVKFAERPTAQKLAELILTTYTYSALVNITLRVKNVPLSDRVILQYLPKMFDKTFDQLLEHSGTNIFGHIVVPSELTNISDIVSAVCKWSYPQILADKSGFAKQLALSEMATPFASCQFGLSGKYAYDAVEITEYGEAVVKLNDSYKDYFRLVRLVKKSRDLARHYRYSNRLIPLSTSVRDLSARVLPGKLKGEFAYKYVYDENGKQHNWNTCIVGDKSVPLADVRKQLADGKIVKSDIIDWKCGVCGTLKSAITDIDEDKVLKQIMINSKRESFYRYFTIRCPVSGSHEYTADKCVKCGITFPAAKMSAADKNTYITKYISKYNPDSGISTDFTIPDYSEKPRELLHSDQEYVKILCDKFDIPLHQLEALGDMIDKDYDEAIATGVVHMVPEFKTAHRITSIKCYANTAIIYYNQLRNLIHIQKPCYFLNKLIEASGKNRAELEPIISKLPLIGLKIEWENIEYHLNPRALVDYTLNMLCKILLHIALMSAPKTEKIRELFVSQYIAHILKTESLLCKAGDFNHAVLGKEPKYAEFEVGEEIIEMEEEEEDDEKRDAFDMDAFDVEIDEDADPDDFVIKVAQD